MNPRLPLRYLGWMARDAALRPGLAGLAFAALAAFIATRLPGPFTETSARDVLIRMVGQLGWLVVLIATTGMVSGDRANGYYRSLFSEPVNPGLYYLQRWLICGVAVAAFVPLTSLGILGVAGSFPFSGPLLARLMLTYLLLGGLTFAFSTLLRADWMFAFLLSVLESLLWGLERSGAPLSAFSKLLVRVLPPFHLGLGGFGAMTYPTGAELSHALLYGAGVVAIALAVLALRPMGSGGRA